MRSARLTPLVALTLLGLGACADAPRKSVAPTVDEAAYRRDLDEWKAKRLVAIAGPDGWATLAGLHWLEDSAYTIGADPTNGIVLPRGHAPKRVGRLTIDGDSVQFVAAKGARIWRDTARAESATLVSDKAGRRPTVLRTGSVTFRIIDRAGKLAVRVKDTANPTRLEFRGLTYFPIDTGVRVTGYLAKYRTPKILKVANIIGQTEEYDSPGVLHFRLAGRDFSLVAARQPGDSSLFLVFRDSTSRTETYPAARFLIARPPDANGFTVVDFNRAYNPPCAFTEYATCPLPVAENVLPVSIRAGEKRYDGAHGYRLSKN